MIEQQAVSQMKRFQIVSETPADCVAAPSIYFAPRPGKKPVGSFNGGLFFARTDVSELRPATDWRRDGRTIKAGEKPLMKRGSIDPIGVYADWQTE